MKHIAIAVFIVVFLTLMPNCMATAQSIDEEWGKVKVPPMPVLENVRIDPASTALLMLDFNKQTCNADRRPRCIATLPKVQKLLTEARAKHVSVIYSLSAGRARPSRAGTVRSDASAFKPAERVSAISAKKPVCSSSVKQGTPTTTAATV